MEARLLHSSEKMLFRSLLGQAIVAERQISTVIPKMMDAVWSTELCRTLRSALTMSRQHQRQLLAYFDVKPGKDSGGLEDLESRIDIAIDSQQKGSLKDLSLTLLAAKMIRHKINCYENALNLGCSNALGDKRMIGGALSDDSAIDVFLQELAERFVLQQFSTQSED
jgi:ferritin-like metal-binding protein YciE